MSIDLRLGDCMAPEGLPALADGSVGCTVTDPPFDARSHLHALEEGDWRKGRRRVGAPLPFAHLDDAQVGAVAAELVRVTRRWLVIFAAERQIEAWCKAIEAAGGRFVRVGVAERANPRPQLSGDRPAPAVDHLVIGHARPCRMRWSGGGKAGRWRMGGARFDEGGQVHPTQKPLELMQALVSDFSEPGELVLDPYAGSGTTALACKKLGRAFLGWEQREDFHATALHRIEAVREQLALDVERRLG